MTRKKRIDTDQVHETIGELAGLARQMEDDKFSSMRADLVTITVTAFGGPLRNSLTFSCNTLVAAHEKIIEIGDALPGSTVTVAVNLQMSGEAGHLFETRHAKEEV